MNPSLTLHEDTEDEINVYASRNEVSIETPDGDVALTFEDLTRIAEWAKSLKAPKAAQS